LGPCCGEVSGEGKFISVKLSKYVEFWKQGIKIKHNLCNEDESICGLLGACFVAFVKTLASSKVHSFGRLLGFKQL
jgi:hypothetical protein